jgi:hypothetical protein
MMGKRPQHQATENGKEECLDASAFLLGAWNQLDFFSRKNE